MLRRVALLGALAATILIPGEALAWGHGGGFGGGHFGGFGGGHFGGFGGGHFGGFGGGHFGGFGGGHFGGWGGRGWGGGFGHAGWGGPRWNYGGYRPYYFRPIVYGGYGYGCYRPRTVWTGWGWAQTWVNVCGYPGSAYWGW